jgi:hypothetical protein
MLRRSRTTKKLAKRIDLQYFTRPHASSLALALVAYRSSPWDGGFAAVR